LFCPSCCEPLDYLHSQVGGVSAKFPEQWDYLACTRCGAFRYRHRTRRLTPVQDATLYAGSLTFFPPG
jgi:hypothetical protein